MSVSRVISPRRRLFTSPKAAAPIPLGSSLQNDALIQAALDPAVVAIDFVSAVTVEGIQVPLSAIVLDREDGRWLLDLPERRPLRDLDDTGLLLLAIDRLGLPTLVVTAADIRRDPRATNAKLVWQCRGFGVGAADRVRLLHFLDECGAGPLVDVAAAARASADGISAVLALACQDLLEIDLASVPLGPRTIVRRRRQRERARRVDEPDEPRETGASE